MQSEKFRQWLHESGLSRKSKLSLDPGNVLTRETDHVLILRMLLSVVQRKRWEYHRMGIDKSSAFDTIRRSSILKLPVEYGCNDDEIRLVRLLRSTTMIRVNVNGTLSAQFQSLLGSFQGDCLSGFLPLCLLAPFVSFALPYCHHGST